MNTAPQTVDSYHSIMADHRTHEAFSAYLNTLTTPPEIDKVRAAIGKWRNLPHPLKDENEGFKQLYIALKKRGEHLGFTQLIGGQWVSRIPPIELQHSPAPNRA